MLEKEYRMRSYSFRIPVVKQSFTLVEYMESQKILIYHKKVLLRLMLGPKFPIEQLSQAELDSINKNRYCDKLVLIEKFLQLVSVDFDKEFGSIWFSSQIREKSLRSIQRYKRLKSKGPCAGIDFSLPGCEVRIYHAQGHWDLHLLLLDD